MCEKFAEIDWFCNEVESSGTSKKVFPYEVAEKMCREFNKLTKDRDGHHIVREVDFKLSTKNINQFTFVHADKCPCFNKIQEKLQKSLR